MAEWYMVLAFTCQVQRPLCHRVATADSCGTHSPSSLPQLGHFQGLVLAPCLVAVAIAVLSLLQRIPKWHNLTEEASGKFPESIWKVLYYGVVWVWGVYLVSAGRENTFFNLRSHWDCKQASVVGVVSLLNCLQRGVLLSPWNLASFGCT